MRSQGKRLNLRRKAIRFGEDLTQKAFYCGRTDRKNKIIYSDEQMDLMKLLIVSDAYPAENKMTVENVDSYLVTKKPSRHDRNKRDIVSDKQRQAPAVETLAAGQKITEGRLSFNVQFLYNLKHNSGIENNEVRHGNDRVYIGIKDKVKQIFNLDLEDLTKQEPQNLEAFFAAKEKEVLLHILDCIGRFSRAQLSHNKDWLQNFKEYDNRRQFTRAIDTGFDTILRGGERTLLNLGYASGFEGTTALLYLLNKQRPQLKEIMELFGIGDKPGAERSRRHGQTYQANPDKFPKSKRLITRSDAIIPLGWLEILNGAENGSSEGSSSVSKSATPPPPATPQYLRGKLKPGVILNAEILSVGKPNKVKLFITENDLQTVDLRYGSGFDADKIGTLVLFKVGSVTKKGKVLSGNFGGFK